MFGCREERDSNHQLERQKPEPSIDGDGEMNGERAAASYWRRKLGAIAVTGGIIAGPHAVCVLASLTGVGAVSFLGYSRWCGHGDIRSSKEVALQQLPRVPERYEDFSDVASAQAVARILDAQPGLHDVLAAKKAESDGAEIQIVFVEDKDSNGVVVGFCKEGMLCPCSRPQFYNVGSFGDLEKPEAFPNQHDVLKVLYNSDGSRR